MTSLQPSYVSSSPFSSSSSYTMSNLSPAQGPRCMPQWQSMETDESDDQQIRYLIMSPSAIEDTYGALDWAKYVRMREWTKSFLERLRMTVARNWVPGTPGGRCSVTRPRNSVKVCTERRRTTSAAAVPFSAFSPESEFIARDRISCVIFQRRLFTLVVVY